MVNTVIINHAPGRTTKGSINIDDYNAWKEAAKSNNAHLKIINPRTLKKPTIKFPLLKIEEVF